MILLSDIKDFIKTLTIEPEGFSVGKINENLSKQIGIFDSDTKSDYKMAIGGLSHKVIKEKKFSILIHWDKNSKNTEIFANKLLSKLVTVNNTIFQNYNISFIIPQYESTIDVNTDDYGIYERMILATIYYTENE